MLIISNQEDSEGSDSSGLSSNPSLQSKYKFSWLKRNFILLASFSAVFVFVGIPFSVQAGMFKPLTDLLGEDLIIYEKERFEQLKRNDSRSQSKSPFNK